MKTRTLVLLSLLTAVLMAYVLTLPAPTPLTAKEIAAFQAKTVWSGTGGTLTATTPIVEIPSRYPIFRIVQVTSYGKDNGYDFKRSYTALDFSHSWSIDVGEIIRNHQRNKTTSI